MVDVRGGARRTASRSLRFLPRAQRQPGRILRREGAEKEGWGARAERAAPSPRSPAHGCASSTSTPPSRSPREPGHHRLRARPPARGAAARRGGADHLPRRGERLLRRGLQLGARRHPRRVRRADPRPERVRGGAEAAPLHRRSGAAPDARGLSGLPRPRASAGSGGRRGALPRRCPGEGGGRDEREVGWPHADRPAHPLAGPGGLVGDRLAGVLRDPGASAAEAAVVSCRPARSRLVQGVGSRCVGSTSCREERGDHRAENQPSHLQLSSMVRRGMAGAASRLHRRIPTRVPHGSEGRPPAIETSERFKSARAGTRRGRRATAVVPAAMNHSGPRLGAVQPGGELRATLRPVPPARSEQGRSEWIRFRALAQSRFAASSASWLRSPLLRVTCPETRSSLKRFTTWISPLLVAST